AAAAAADSAQQHADNAAEAAKNAYNAAVEAGKAADRAEEAARKAEEERRRQQAGSIDEGAAGLSEDERDMLRYQGGDELIEQYERAMADANKGVIDFIKEHGGQVLLELIGEPEAKKCFGEGDVISCLWTVVNVGSLLLLIAKIPAVAAAITKIAGGLAKFLEGAAAGKGLLNRLRNGLADIKRIPCNCFPAGTPVAVANGSKPIEQIAVGDHVWARQISTGRSQLRRVEGLFNKHATEMLTISVGENVHVTPQHPFWVVGKGWVDAGKVAVGDQFQSLSGGKPVVEAVTVQPVVTTVYNFEVEGDHNYYITKAQLLVHNCDVKSLIKNDSFLVKAAEKAGSDQKVQKELDELIGKFMSGNKNPGLGTSPLPGTGLSYLRGRDGGRVFFRINSEGAMEVVAKASKANEDQVIARLKELYGK
ncbi:polymorphic toxin-type HINT domain-containing protein, partial [Kibdelosporangium persicum]